ncbi:helix-turn-helix domain-containing protein [Vibrio nitrifigilis]|uniref:Helix-turn-helix domain-containing protein n=1 Tax=Vibrio nitrifigilis TaxID=2789781 RepID=A0ABS0GE77_9VIBR|nr:helix-turn-helix domain-containing protein [Vibrio nitrifigilis]MBF9000716.1 helix-turn-helix domain-containing protein [Vibrio nitrifigilis]
MLYLTYDEYVGNESNIRVLGRKPQVDYPEHCHDFSELVLVCHGSGTHIVNGQQSLLLPNSICCVSERDYHQYLDTKDVHLVNVLYSKSNLNIHSCCVDVIKKLESEQNNFLITQSAFQPIFNLALAIEKEQNNQRKNTKVMVNLLFEQLLLCIERLDSRVTENSPVINALVYLANHYADPDLSVAIVCEQFKVTPKALAKEISQLTGMSTNRFINHLRIRHAIGRLRQGESVTSVAFECGYTDSNYFSSKFKTVTGINPSAFRKQTLVN